MDNKSSPEVESKLQYYVYALVDPRTDQIFYVGKGAATVFFNTLPKLKPKTKTCAVPVRI